MLFRSEDIEALMISFAMHDPAFASITDAGAFRTVMGLAAEMTLSTRPLGGDVHLITGAGSNVVVKVTPDAVLIVDTGYGPALPALQRTIAELGGGAVDVVIITHPHEDHMGSAAELGVEAQLYAHSGTAAAMAEPYEIGRAHV